MSSLSKAQRADLTALFGERANFDPRERVLYGHDIAAVPSLFKPLLGKTVPDAVVQPANEEELLKLARWAGREGIALTPRGKASSGYGGVLPVKRGVVVDFYRMNHVVRIDAAAGTVTVEPGIVWEKLDRALAKEDLTLRLYPTSYPASTVGGWLAQGGAGIGSYEAGWFRDNVVSARAVLPDSGTRTFTGNELDLIADAEGITGFISEVTLRVQPLEALDVVAVGCPNEHDLQRFVQALVDANVPIWSLSFINPRMAELKNKAPLMEHYGHPVEERVLLPAAYITTLAFRARDKEAVLTALPKLL
ncbi:MAG TPA: FAD-binding oxidoreductase, partial [Armatimonadota bacterium]